MNIHKIFQNKKSAPPPPPPKANPPKKKRETGQLTRMNTPLKLHMTSPTTLGTIHILLTLNRTLVILKLALLQISLNLGRGLGLVSLDLGLWDAFWRS